MHRILIFEPNPSEALRYRDVLAQSQYWAVASSDLQEARQLFETQLFHGVLWTVNDEQDLCVISELKQRRPTVPFVAMSLSEEPKWVVQCMRSGCADYWKKGPELADLVSVVQATAQRFGSTPIDMGIDFPFPQFVGRHPKIVEIFQQILKIKDTDSTVLITGESGTGKEVVAQAIHQLSRRRRAPFVAVNCGAIPSGLLESELFGHVKGAFTGATHHRIGRFQKAGDGTLFLDEITDLPFELQAKLLRAIQTKTFEPVGSPTSVQMDARIIAATNKNIDESVAAKEFRGDLYYRLNVIPIFVPPLRARKSDIPLLVRTFLDKFSKQHNRNVIGISEEAMQTLMHYQWPGNIRELENLIERTVILKGSEGLIELKDLPVEHFKAVRLDRFVANVALPEEGIDFNDAVGEFENELILQALQKTEGNKNKAATLLKLNRTTLVEKLKRKNLRLAS